MDIKLVNGDYWQGLYVDGILYTEDHSISIPEIISIIQKKIPKIELKFEELWCDIDWLDNEGQLPESLSDVKLVNYEGKW